MLTTPEFLHFHAERFAERVGFGFVVVDEAHHVGLSRAGHRPAYARLGEAVDALGGPDGARGDRDRRGRRGRVDSRLRWGSRRSCWTPRCARTSLIEDRRSCTAKDDLIAALAATGDKTIVYVNSRDASVRLARMLRKRVPELAWRAAFYNGGLSRSVRHAVERAFRAGDVRVVVATSAFGEGVNIPDIRNVVLYHLPFNDVEFNQMSGRVGRDGAVARVHLLFGDKDARINERILASSRPSETTWRRSTSCCVSSRRARATGFEITNAELAERCAQDAARMHARRARCLLGARRLPRARVSSTGEGHGAYRRLTLVPGAERGRV